MLSNHIFCHNNFSHKMLYHTWYIIFNILFLSCFLLLFERKLLCNYIFCRNNFNHQLFYLKYKRCPRSKKNHSFSFILQGNIMKLTVIIFWYRTIFRIPLYINISFLLDFSPCYFVGYLCRPKTSTKAKTSTEAKTST